MSYQIRIVIFWVLLLVCMMLHFDYHVSGIFYGVDVKRPGVNGVPVGTLVVIRTLFHFLPIIFLLMVSSFTEKPVRLINLAAACLYCVSHAFHLFGEFRHTPVNPSQVTLLALTLAVSLILAFVSWRWLKSKIDDAPVLQS